jgi:hypothetical protein
MQVSSHHEASQENCPMVEFWSKQNRKLTLDLEQMGVSFHYVTAGDVYHVGWSWSNLHTLLMKLYQCQSYSARDQSLSLWLQDRELCIRFRAGEHLPEEVCSFAPGETSKIMDFLGRAPNLN